MINCVDTSTFLLESCCNNTYNHSSSLGKPIHTQLLDFSFDLFSTNQYIHKRVHKNNSYIFRCNDQHITLQLLRLLTGSKIHVNTGKFDRSRINRIVTTIMSRHEKLIKPVAGFFYHKCSHLVADARFCYELDFKAI